MEKPKQQFYSPNNSNCLVSEFYFNIISQKNERELVSISAWLKNTTIYEGLSTSSIWKYNLNPKASSTYSNDATSSLYTKECFGEIT